MSSPPTPSDPTSDAFAQLVERARTGETEALDELFRRFYPIVRRRVHQNLDRDLRRSRPWLSTRFSTGDVVQEVFRSALLDLAGFNGRSEREFASYLGTIVRNRLLDVVRFHEAARRDGRRPRAAANEIDVPAASGGPATLASSAEERRMFDEALASFPKDQRALLHARLELGLDFPAITSRLDFSSVSATRRAFFAAHSLLVIRLRRLEADLES